MVGAKVKHISGTGQEWPLTENNYNLNLEHTDWHVQGKLETHYLPKSEYVKCASVVNVTEQLEDSSDGGEEFADKGKSYWAVKVLASKGYSLHKVKYEGRWFFEVHQTEKI